jgi:hypothetical protein
LNGVKVVDVSGDVVLDLTTEDNLGKIGAIDALNLEAAQENCETWFGKQLSEKVIEGAYTPSVADGQITGECIEATKVFNTQQEQVDLETVQPGKTCDVILEFAGLWFAKNLLAPHGMLSRSEFTQTQSWTLTQRSTPSWMSNKKIVIIYKR